MPGYTHYEERRLFIVYILISYGFHGNCFGLQTSTNFIGPAPFSPTGTNVTWQAGPGGSADQQHPGGKNKCQTHDPTFFSIG